MSAGCAIGIGNVWKFPYVAGQNGGGVFVLLYLIFLLIMGVPVLTMEFAVGRASRKSTVEAYKVLEKNGQKWHLHGWVGVIGCFILMTYYTTVSGWMLGYFFKFASGRFVDATAGQSALIFEQMLGDPLEMLILTGMTVLIGLVVCSFGLQNGIERISKIMMLGLLGLIVILALNSLTLDGASEGLKFYLFPDFKRVAAKGIGDVLTAAMTQAFFTLSIGIASMEIFGSYMSKEHTLADESLRICGLDTFAAIMSGLIIFPACFSFGVVPDAGPPLIFITLPEVFISMTGGRIWGSLFFVFMSFASLSTVIAVFENIIASCMDSFEWSRKKAVLIFGVIMFAASVPCVLGYNLWKDFTPIGGRNILESEDYFVSTILLPSGALIYLLFCVTNWGWGFDNYVKEVNTGRGIVFSKKLKPYFQFVLPLLIIAVFVSGLV